MLRLDITPYKSGVYREELHPAPDDLEFDFDVFDDIHGVSDVHIDAVLQAHRDRILVHLDVEADVELTCDRTLDRYDEPVEGSYSVLFGPPSLVGTDSDEYDEVRPLEPGDLEIDLTDVVRDTILLSVPQRKIAPGAESADIQMEFGVPDEPDDEVEEPVDPRWSKLKQLKSEGEDDE
jgi:uncharacterized protein